MNKLQAKMLRQVQGQSAKKRPQKPRNDQHHWCRAVLENGVCPKCTDQTTYRIYCNRCMHVHVAAQRCRAWKYKGSVREVEDANV